MISLFVYSHSHAPIYWILFGMTKITNEFTEFNSICAHQNGRRMLPLIERRIHVLFYV